MAADKLRIGAECNVFNNTGTYGTPVWTALTNVGDVTLSASKVKTKVNARAGGAVNRYRGTVSELSLSIMVPGDIDHATFTTLYNAYNAGTILDLFVTTQTSTTTGEPYTRCDWEVFSIEEDQSFEGVVMYKVELAPSYSVNPLLKGLIA